jgi:hypothetical protein
MGLFWGAPLILAVSSSGGTTSTWDFSQQISSLTSIWIRMTMLFISHSETVSC